MALTNTACLTNLADVTVPKPWNLWLICLICSLC